MRVVCDNCGASYKIPDSKLTKEVNKATCRKCGHAIFIKRAGEEEASPTPAPASPHGDERTLITSAADLERAVRARAGTGFEEPADQRPTTVSIEHQGEATVPREPQAPAAFPAPAPFVPAAPAFPPPAPPRPAARPTLSPAAEVAPPPPAPVRSAPSAAPRPADAAPADGLAASFDPRSDLSMALVALLVTVAGVLVLAVSTWLQSPVVAGLGAFLALFGTFVVALILVTGGRGTRAASLAISFLGGLVLASAFGAILGSGLYVMARPVVAVATPEPVQPPVAAVAPPVVATPVAPPVVAAPPVVETPPVVEAPPVAVAPPAPVAPTPTAPTPTAKAAPVAPAPAPVAAKTPTKAPASTSSRPATSETEPAPARITPTSTSTSKSTSSTPTKTTSTSAAPAASSTSGASSGVSAVVIDTMIKSNKAVKSCFIQQRNETGELPRGVKVKLTIQPSGKVSSATMPGGDLQGSTFDSCLSSAVKSIQFPPFEGESVTVTYPFSI